MVETLEQLDRSLFLWLNSKHNGLLDVLMPYITNIPMWVPFYAYLLIILYKELGRKILIAVLALAFLLTFSDQSSGFLKKSIKRYRPTHNTEISGQVHTVDNYKGSKYGFVSSHAANVFAVAFFFVFLFGKKRKKFSLVLLGWALLVSYSRIYLGVHYPSDIIGGALLGILLAFIAYRAYLYFADRTETKTPA